MDQMYLTIEIVLGSIGVAMLIIIFVALLYDEMLRKKAEREDARWRAGANRNSSC